MDSRYLKYFVAVAEDLNFTKAAERLHTVQPSLSQQIKRLEEMVGVPLFHRMKHRVSLTEAGRVFLEDANRILRDVEKAFSRARQAAKAESGAMAIGFIPGTEMKVFPQILPLLSAAIPDLDLSLRSLTSPQQLVALINREINLGFLRGPVPFPEIASSVVLREEIVVAMPARHELARLRKIPLELIGKCRFLRVSRDVAPSFHDLTMAILEQAGVHSSYMLDSENALTSISGVASGMGLALLPSFVERIVPPGVVIRRLDLPQPPTIELLAAYRKDDALPALACLLELLQNHSLEDAPGRKRP
jgi:LysR family hca operon transcriptional activator